MRIAVYHELPSGGAKRTLYETVKRLSPSHEIDMYTLEGADGGYCDPRPFCAGYRVFPFHPPRLFRTPLGRLNQLQRWRGLLRLAGIARQSAAEVDSRGYDVVFAQPSMWSQAPLIMMYLRTPVLYYCQEAPRALYEPDPRASRHGFSTRQVIDRIDPLIRLYRATARHLDRRALRAARRVLVNSDFTRQVVKSIYGIDPIVCYHGVDASLFRPMPHIERQPFVLSVGAVQPRKGFDFLIESLALIDPARRPDLLLVGNAEDSHERRYLQSLAALKGVGLRVEVGIGDTELVRRYNQARLVVYAPHGEPFGLVPLEAMACATPVIGVDEGGVRESVVSGVTGLLVERDKEQFARAVIDLLQEPRLLERYSRQGRQHVLANWTWDRAVERVEEQLTLIARQSEGTMRARRTMVTCQADSAWRGSSS